jgi:hypothetical protein
MRYDGVSPTRCGTVGVSPGKQICSAVTVRTSCEVRGARRWHPWVKRGGGLGSYRGEVRMHTEIEGRDGPERCHGGLLPPRLGGSFPPLLTGAE